MANATISPVKVMKAHRVIAVVGASKNPEKEAHTVPAYLKDHGYRVVPVNPSAGQILGEKAFPSLASLPEQLAREVEVVEVFRPSEELPQVAREVVEMSRKYGKSYIFWSQLGLENDEAKAMLTEAKILYVMNACMRVVHASATRGD